jgi:hypothetical protein
LYGKDSYEAESQISPRTFELFTQALSGEEIDITPFNYRDLLRLSEEFGHRSLQAQISSFIESNLVSDSSNYDCCARLFDIEERFLSQERHLCSLQCEVSELRSICGRFLSLRDEISRLGAAFSGLGSVQQRISNGFVTMKQELDRLGIAFSGLETIQHRLSLDFRAVSARFASQQEVNCLGAVFSDLEAAQGGSRRMSRPFRLTFVPERRNEVTGNCCYHPRVNRKRLSSDLVSVSWCESVVEPPRKDAEEQRATAVQSTGRQETAPQPPRPVPARVKPLIFAPTSPLKGIIAHLTKKCGGNVHDKGVVTVTSSPTVNDESAVQAKNVADLDTMKRWFCSAEGPPSDHSSVTTFRRCECAPHTTSPELGQAKVPPLVGDRGLCGWTGMGGARPAEGHGGDERKGEDCDIRGCGVGLLSVHPPHAARPLLER